MTPVISPWVFYAISVADGVKTVSIIGLAVSLVVIVVLGVMLFCEYDWEEEFPDKCKNYAKYIKRFAIALVAFVLFSILVPSSNTITKMIVAQNVTYERVEVATDTVQEVYEDIMELFGGKEE